MAVRGQKGQTEGKAVKIVQVEDGFMIKVEASSGTRVYVRKTVDEVMEFVKRYYS